MVPVALKWSLVGLCLACSVQAQATKTLVDLTFTATDFTKLYDIIQPTPAETVTGRFVYEYEVIPWAPRWDVKLLYVDLNIGGYSYKIEEIDFVTGENGIGASAATYFGSPVIGTNLFQLSLFNVYGTSISEPNYFAYSVNASPLFPSTGREQNLYYTTNVTFSVAPVPEPAQWLFLLAGFGIVGAAVRQRAAAGPASGNLR